MEQSIRWHAVAGAYEHHRDRLVSSLSRLYPHAVVEDAVQDLFLKLARIGFGDPDRLTDRYLWRSANRAVRRRLMIEERRLTRLRDRVSSGFPGDELVELDHACLAGGQVQHESLAQALGAVDPREMEVFRMLICQGMTYREAACALGESEHQVTNLRARGLRRLRDRVASVADEHAVQAPSARCGTARQAV